MRESNQKPSQSPNRKLYLVETKDTVYASERKLDAAYKHVEFKYGQAKYREVSESEFQTTKRLVRL